MLAERQELEQEQLEDRVIRIDRTRKTVAGGRISSARVVVAIGDHKGSVGLGVGKARAVPEAISKAINQARRGMLRVPLDGYTITHAVQAKVGGAVILLRPAARGTGVVAGGATRQLIELSGIRDILTKSLGSGNVMNRAKACFKALSLLRDPHEVAAQRDTTVEKMLGRQVVDAYAEIESAEAEAAEAKVAEQKRAVEKAASEGAAVAAGEPQASVGEDAPEPPARAAGEPAKQ